MDSILEPIVIIYILITVLIAVAGFYTWVDGNCKGETALGVTLVWPLLVIKFGLRSIFRVLFK